MSILLSRARDGHCRWIVCEAVEPRRGEPRDTFGGRRVCGAPASLPTSYCAEHRLRVYERAPAVRVGGDGTMARAQPAAEPVLDLMEIFA
jgi:hypothetical protein